MGEPKALLSHKNGRLIDFVALQCQALGFDVYVSGQVESFNCIPDLVPQLGPMGGIMSACFYLSKIENSSIESILFIPVDLPYLTKDALMPLMDFLSNPHNEADAVIYKNNPLPLALSLNDKVYYQLEQFFKTKENSRSVRRFLATINTHSITATKEQLLAITSTNTPSEWQAFKEKSLL